MDLTPPPHPLPRRLLLGFSGGLDSTVLLHRLSALAAQGGAALRAVHVHHGLHPDAELWAAHAVTFAGSLGVPVMVERVAVAAQGAGGLEQAARDARYAAFARHRTDDEWLVLAHHRDDQAETVLLALLRGSGERGLAAMQAFTEGPRGPVWRPLLDVPRSALAQYARIHGLSWVDDPSNADPRHRRNALRHEVLPLLEARWPGAGAALARSAALLAEADALCTEQAGRDVAALRGLDGSTLDAAELRALPAPRARRALRRWTESVGSLISADALDRALGAWAGAPPGRALRHALGPHWLYQWQERLWLVARPLPDAAPRWSTWADAAAAGAADALQLHGAAALPFEGFQANRSGLTAHGGAAQRRSAAQANARMARLRVPPWQRDQVPLLCDADGALKAVADLHYAPDFVAWLRAAGARLVWPQAAPLR